MWKEGTGKTFLTLYTTYGLRPHRAHGLLRHIAHMNASYPYCKHDITWKHASVSSPVPNWASKAGSRRPTRFTQPDAAHHCPQTQNGALPSTDTHLYARFTPRNTLGERNLGLDASNLKEDHLRHMTKAQLHTQTIMRAQQHANFDLPSSTFRSPRPQFRRTIRQHTRFSCRVGSPHTRLRKNRASPE